MDESSCGCACSLDVDSATCPCSLSCCLFASANIAASFAVAYLARTVVMHCLGSSMRSIKVKPRVRGRAEDDDDTVEDDDEDVEEDR